MPGVGIGVHKRGKRGLISSTVRGLSPRTPRRSGRIRRAVEGLPLDGVPRPLSWARRAETDLRSILCPTFRCVLIVLHFPWRASWLRFIPISIRPRWLCSSRPAKTLAYLRPTWRADRVRRGLRRLLRSWRAAPRSGRRPPSAGRSASIRTNCWRRRRERAAKRGAGEPIKLYGSKHSVASQRGSVPSSSTGAAV